MESSRSSAVGMMDATSLGRRTPGLEKISGGTNKMKSTKHILATITTTVLLGWSVPSHAGLFPGGTQWNAYNDFYFSPNVSGSGAPSSASALGVYQTFQNIL